MAERLAHRDLRNRSAEVLRAVAGGATYEITNHGEVVAVLSPWGQPPGRLQVRPAKIRGRWGDIEAVPGSGTTEEALRSIREDR